MVGIFGGAGGETDREYVQPLVQLRDGTKDEQWSATFCSRDSSSASMLPSRIENHLSEPNSFHDRGDDPG